MVLQLKLSSRLEPRGHTHTHTHTHARAGYCAGPTSAKRMQKCPSNGSTRTQTHAFTRAHTHLPVRAHMLMHALRTHMGTEACAHIHSPPTYPTPQKTRRVRSRAQMHPHRPTSPLVNRNASESIRRDSVFPCDAVRCR